jgi:subtilase family serine protease
MKKNRQISYILLLLILSFLLPPAAALYDFEGLPLTVTAQGSVQGDVLTFGKYGLDNPPYELQFTLPSAPVYARVYTGIWGGTEKYTGWADMTINNVKKVRYLLNGDRDQNKELYESGHGIYWIAYDTTRLLNKGDNLVNVMTSKDETGNKLDGRVYGIVVVAVVEDPASGRLTQYWIAEGNENLHGEGWAGTNPTRHENTSLTFTNAATAGMTRSNLSVLLLAGGKGQPDYVQFNGRYLGIPVRIAGTQNVTDIGDEISFDATGDAGTPSRYADAEVFDVTTFVQDSNTILFSRGIDLDGDGTIATAGDAPEGEDYIHPVIALLTIEKPGSAAATDLAPVSISAENAYSGETATLSADIRNYGILPDSPVPVTFAINGKAVNTTQVTIPKSGVAVVQVPWLAEEGSITISAEAAAPGDSRADNNAVSRTITVGTPPDLALSVGSPVHKGNEAGASASKSPLPAGLSVAALGALLLFRARGKGHPALLPAVVLALVVMLALPVFIAPAGAVEGIQEYSLPLTIANNGGSDASAFTVTVYLDGEKSATKLIDGGIDAHSSVTVAIPLFTSPGTHELKVTVDEAGIVRDNSRNDNTVQGRYDFPT